MDSSSSSRLRLSSTPCHVAREVRGVTHILQWIFPCDVIRWDVVHSQTRPGNETRLGPESTSTIHVPGIGEREPLPICPSLSSSWREGASGRYGVLTEKEETETHESNNHMHIMALYRTDLGHGLL